MFPLTKLILGVNLHSGVEKEMFHLKSGERLWKRESVRDREGESPAWCDDVVWSKCLRWGLLMCYDCGRVWNFIGCGWMLGVLFLRRRGVNPLAGRDVDVSGSITPPVLIHHTASSRLLQSYKHTPGGTRECQNLAGWPSWRGTSSDSSYRFGSRRAKFIRYLDSLRS